MCGPSKPVKTAQIESLVDAEIAHDCPHIKNGQKSIEQRRFLQINAQRYCYSNKFSWIINIAQSSKTYAHTSSWVIIKWLKRLLMKP